MTPLLPPMIVTLIPYELKLPTSNHERGDGVHLSGIIRSIAGLTGVLKKEWVEDLSLTDVREITDPIAILRICIGLAWEEWFIPQLEEAIDHPGEMFLEGIYMNHDADEVSRVFYNRLNLSVIEVKSTYKSIRTVGDLTSQWMWITQMKGYCKGLDTRFAQLYALFLCGDYSYPIRPVLLRWAIEFTQDEIDDTWDMMKEYMLHRLTIEAEGLRGDE